MCGIAGFVHGAGPEHDRVADTLVRALSRRGPDGPGQLSRAGATLVHTRLAIIDLTAAVRYPMSNEDDDVHLTFNGEIYNHHALRRELAGLGHRFATRCDAEVVLHGYEEWGEDVFGRLRGMFAIGLLDERRRRLTVARDRFGIKPLAWTTEGAFAFSSDAMALVEAGVVRGEIDLAAVREFLTFHYVPAPRSGIVGVEMLAPGSLVRYDLGTAARQVVPWADGVFSDNAAAADQAAPSRGADLRDAIVRAVESQLIADVPVGVFLSGGLDSATILAAAHEAGASPQAFTLTFPGSGDYDEEDRASRLARRLGVEHHRIPFESGFIQAVTGVADAFDVPFADSSAVAMLGLAAATREHVTVALSGTGGDDLFAGYYRHRAHLLRPVVDVVPRWVLDTLGRQVAPAAARKSAGSLARSYVGRLARASSRSDIEQYLALAGGLTSPAADDCVMVPLDRRTVRAGVAERLGLFRAGGDVLRRIQRFELASYLPGDLLVKEDRASMAVGLEARVPLLDESIAAIASALPAREMINLRSGKRPIRLAAEQLVGDDLQAVKRGFAVPLHDLLYGSWRDDAQLWFAAASSDLVDGARVAARLRDASIPATDVWLLATLVAWEVRLRDARGNTQMIVSGS